MRAVADGVFEVGLGYVNAHGRAITEGAAGRFREFTPR
jgi:hypothetical protein